MAEWGRLDASNADRVTHLKNGSGGLNGTTKLAGTTISNDSGATDQLTGGGDIDWFFKSSGDNLNDFDAGLGEALTTI